MTKATASDDITKAAVLSLLHRGLATPSEAAKLAGRSRQIVRHWAKGGHTRARASYLQRTWRRALAHARPREAE